MGWKPGFLARQGGWTTPKTTIRRAEEEAGARFRRRRAARRVLSANGKAAGARSALEKITPDPWCLRLHLSWHFLYKRKCQPGSLFVQEV
jgi:hypothetical protein